MSQRKNKPVTDLKYNTKRRVKSVRGKVEQIAAQWGDVDFFIVSRCEENMTPHPSRGYLSEDEWKKLNAPSTDARTVQHLKKIAAQRKRADKKR